MKLSIKVIFGACVACLCASLASARFAYERNSCDTSVFSVIQEMLANEMRIIISAGLKMPNNKQVIYELYTRQNPYERQVLELGNSSSIQRSFFNPQWPVRFSIHGWAGKGATCSNAAIKDAYLSQGDINVIIMDWSAYALDISYTRISKQLPTIAKNLVKFSQFLHSTTGANYSNMYLVGHSAGSHIAGLAGKALRPYRYGAIIALDPAGLVQLHQDETQRLTRTDAPYIESIHSDITLLGNPSTELSHASFFPNWGQGQPHCPNATAAEFDFACDHFAALYYFVESIRDPKLFGAIRCKNHASIEHFNCGCGQSDNQKNGKCAAQVYMGGEPAIPKSGIYYFSTQSRPPFGTGETVRVRRPTSPNFLRSSVLTKQFVNRFFVGIRI